MEVNLETIYEMMDISRSATYTDFRKGKFDLEYSRCQLLSRLCKILETNDRDKKVKHFMDAWDIGIYITANEFENHEFSLDQDLINRNTYYASFSETVRMAIENRTTILETLLGLTKDFHISFEVIVQDFKKRYNEK